MALLPMQTILRQRFFAVLFFWGLQVLGYLGLYFVFPLVGLVDVRAFPQIQLFLCLAAAISAGAIFRQLGHLFSWLLVFPAIIAGLWWASISINNFPNWVRWNYSGWTTKALYDDVQELSAELRKRGDFSSPRVVYEHNDVNEAAGTLRVFEMLPYFAGRATLESVYLQASILSPMIYHLQADVSKTPSCPFTYLDCPKQDIDGAWQRLRRMGVGELILTSEPALEQARASSHWSEVGSFGAMGLV